MVQIILIAFQAFVAFLIGTFVFDIVHFLLHQAMKSKIPILKIIGHLHRAHHRFYTADLKINKNWSNANLFNHVLLEYIVQVCGTLFCLVFLSPLAIVLALLFETAMFIGICYCRGVDLHHNAYDILPSYRCGFFVSAAYHALHHVYPTRFYSGYIKLIDYVLGTAHHLSGKQVVMTGANGALGSRMKILLEREGAQVTAFKFGEDYQYDNYDKLIPELSKADILLLCHGSKYENAQQANCDSFVRIIELFKSVRKRGLLPVEIWGVGSEIECHPCFGIKKIKVYAASKRNYAKYAREYFYDSSIQYRHLVHAAFMSSMGPGLMSANFAAKLTLFLIKRGFKYVPVTYTGFAYLNYFRFIFSKYNFRQVQRKLPLL